MPRRRDAVARLRSTPDAAVLAYVSVLVLAVVQAVVLDEPGQVLAGTVPYVLALLVVVVVDARGPIDEDGLLRWLDGLAVLGTLLAAWLLGSFLVALPSGVGEPSGFYHVKVRVTSPVGDHNTAAGLLLPALVACAATAVRRPRGVGGIGFRVGGIGLRVGGVGIVTLGIVATLSRGAALVLLGMAVVAWLLHVEWGLRLLLSAAAVACVAGVLGLALLLDASPPEGAGTEQGVVGASIVGRADLAVRGIEVARAQPLLGVGLGGFEQAAEDLPPPNDHAHQLLAHAAAEGGAVLLAVAVLVPALLAVRVLRQRGRLGGDALLLGGLGLVVHAQAEILGGRVGYEVLLALFVALAGGLETARPPGRPGIAGGAE